MKQNDKKKLPLWGKLLIAFGIVVAILTVCFLVYVNDYYHADEKAMEALRGCDGVTVTIEDKGRIIYAPDGRGEHPDLHAGLLFYPGGKVAYEAYAPLMEKLALRGITCILLKMPCNLAIMKVDAADGVTDAYETIEQWYIGGHSLGGVASAMYLADGHADEYEGLLLLGAYASSDLSDTDLAVLSVYGEKDGVLDRTQYEEARSNLPADVAELIIPGGCHAYFGCYGEQKGDGAALITPDEQQEMTADAVAAWIGEHL